MKKENENNIINWTAEKIVEEYIKTGNEIPKEVLLELPDKVKFDLLNGYLSQDSVDLDFYLTKLKYNKSYIKLLMLQKEKLDKQNKSLLELENEIAKTSTLIEELIIKINEIVTGSNKKKLN